MASPLAGALMHSLRLVGIDVVDQTEPAGNVKAVVLAFDSATNDVMDAVRQEACRATVIAVGGDGVAPELVWRLLQNGAADVVAAPDAAEAAGMIRSRLNRLTTVEALLRQTQDRDHMIGRSPAWMRVLRQLAEVAHFSRAGVLITGESGTGKEMAARLIHALASRPGKGPFVPLDCGTVSAELAGSELFGHVRGAYTGAIAEREGALSLANGGTLFLDELGELPLSVQAQLLRAIEEKAFKPVGAVQWKRSDFRLVCATNRDLGADVAAGRFRLDLYHRVLAWHIQLPPLRDRPDDIVPLALHFARAANDGSAAPRLDPAVERYLLTREYPGNIRDLRQLMVRVMTRHDGPGPVTVGDIPPADRPRPDRELRWPDEPFELAVRRGLTLGRGLKEIGRDAEAVAMNLALGEADGNSRRAAEVLRISERAVQMRRAAVTIPANPPSNTSGVTGRSLAKA